MKDQAPMMNHQSQMMSMGQPPPPIMSQPQQQVMNNQKSQMLLMNPSQMMMNINQPQQSQGMLSHRGGGGYGMWQPPPLDQLKFPNSNMKPSGFGSSSSKHLGPRNNKNWKGKKGNDKRNTNIRKELPVMAGGSSISGSSGGIGMGGGGGGYQPPTLKELQQQNRLKARRYFAKKKFNHGGRSAPFAPRNTTSFLIRAKKSGGITSLVSPCPVTPAVLPTPIFSPSREVLVDMAKEEWGVDGYGSMKGLIRLRSPGNEADAPDDEEDEEGGSSESDVEEHVEVERRLDHDLSRFEMIYPSYGGAEHSSYLLENRVDDQDTHIAQLEEENLILKERLFLMEREFDDLRMRLQCLERQNRGAQGFNEEVVENDSENESESRGFGRSMEENNEVMEENNEGNRYSVEDGNNGEAEMKGTYNIEKGLQTMKEGVNDDAEAQGCNDIERNKEGSNVVGVEDVCMAEHMKKNEENTNEDIKSNKEKNDIEVETEKGNDNDFVANVDSNSMVIDNEEVGSVSKEEGPEPARNGVVAANQSREGVIGSEN